MIERGSHLPLEQRQRKHEQPASSKLRPQLQMRSMISGRYRAAKYDIHAEHVAGHLPRVRWIESHTFARGSKSPIPSLADCKLRVPVRIQYAAALNRWVSLRVVRVFSRGMELLATEQGLQSALTT